MKKYLLIIGIVIITLAVLGTVGFLVLKGKKKVEPVTPPKQEGKLIETTLEERPFVTLTPRADGKELTLEISRIKNAESIDYELEYLAGELTRGVIGTIRIQNEAKVSRNLLLGSCSRNVCKYDENVSGGTLTLKFRSQEGVRKFVSDFSLQQGGSELLTRDEKFKLSGKFASGTFYVTMSTIGLPGETDGEVVAGPYGVFTAGSSTVKNTQLTMTIPEGKSSANLFAWGGAAWKEVSGAKVEGTEISANFSNLTTFIITATTPTQTPE